MLEKTFEEQKSYGVKLQEKFDFLTNEDVLTTVLPFREDIPDKVKEQTKNFRIKVKELIAGIAYEIQELKFRQIDRDVSSAGLSKFQSRRYNKFRDAQKELGVSYDSVRQSLNYITDFNKSIIERITEAKGGKKTNLLILNAVIVHELSDIIIELIEQFQLNGKDTLRSINDQVLDELRSQQRQDLALLGRANNGDDAVAAGVKKSIEERNEIRAIVEKKWDKIWNQVKCMEDNIENAKGYLPNLKLIRDNAKGQINILEVVGMVQVVQSNLQNFQDICAVTNMNLAPISKEDIYELIGRVEEVIEG